MNKNAHDLAWIRKDELSKTEVFQVRKRCGAYHSPQAI